jgi:hypothetical protein
MNRQHVTFPLSVYPCAMKQRCTFPQQALRTEFAAFIIYRLYFRGFFSLLAVHCLILQDDSVHIIKEKI